MGIWERVGRANRRTGYDTKAARTEAERQAYLADLATRRFTEYTPRAVYEELLELRARVAALEARQGV